MNKISFLLSNREEFKTNKELSNEEIQFYKKVLKELNSSEKNRLIKSAYVSYFMKKSFGAYDFIIEYKTRIDFNKIAKAKETKRIKEKEKERKFYLNQIDFQKNLKKELEDLGF